MAESTSNERVAEILWTARKSALGYGSMPLAEAPARIREQYHRFAAKVAQQLGQDQFASDRTVIQAAIDSWQDGHIAPHDALTAIRDQLEGRIPGEEATDA